MPVQTAATKVTTVKDYEARLLKVLAFIDANLDDAGDIDLNLDDLAAIAHFSPYHFHRIFKGMTGETLGGFIRRRRLEKAAQKLISGDRSITAAALDAGFENSESFSRAFKQHFGLPPSQFRRLGAALLTRQALESAYRQQFETQAQTLSRYMEIEGRKAMFEVQIKPFNPIRLAFISHTGPYNQIGPVFERAMEAAGEQSLFGPSTQIMALYYDDPHAVDAAALRSEAGLSVPEGTPVAAPLEEKTIAGGDYGVAIYKGGYDGLQVAYDWLYGQWLPESGREADGQPCLEIYLTDPAQTKPEDNLTEIRIPLK